MVDKKNPEVSETELVAAFQQGKVEVLATLYDRYAAVLMGLVSRMLPDQDQAETALQDTFLEAWTRRTAYDPEQCRLLTWMIMIARDKALAIRINAPSHPEKPNAGLNPTGGLHVPPADALLSDRLSPLEKTVLDLVYLHRYSCDEAADLLGITEENIKASLRRACQLLRAEKPA